MGKVTVIKKLCTSKAHLCSFLPYKHHQTKLSNESKKMMYKFIWEGKPDKIKRETLIKECDKGGLKMLELRTFIKSFKITWVKRIVETDETGNVSQLYLNKLKQYGRKLFFQFSDKDVDKIIPKNTFFKVILTAWCSENISTVILCYGNEI